MVKRVKSQSDHRPAWTVHGAFSPSVYIESPCRITAHLQRLEHPVAHAQSPCQRIFPATVSGEGNHTAKAAAACPHLHPPSLRLATARCAISRDIAMLLHNRHRSSSEFCQEGSQVGKSGQKPLYGYSGASHRSMTSSITMAAASSTQGASSAPKMIFSSRDMFVSA